jgi:hypothetical protein
MSDTPKKPVPAKATSKTVSTDVLQAKHSELVAALAKIEGNIQELEAALRRSRTNWTATDGARQVVVQLLEEQDNAATKQ